MGHQVEEETDSCTWVELLPNFEGLHKKLDTLEEDSLPRLGRFSQHFTTYFLDDALVQELQNFRLYEEERSLHEVLWALSEEHVGVGQLNELYFLAKVSQTLLDMVLFEHSFKFSKFLNDLSLHIRDIAALASWKVQLIKLFECGDPHVSVEGLVSWPLLLELGVLLEIGLRLDTKNRFASEVIIALESALHFELVTEVGHFRSHFLKNRLWWGKVGGTGSFLDREFGHYARAWVLRWLDQTVGGFRLMGVAFSFFAQDSESVCLKSWEIWI